MLEEKQSAKRIMVSLANAPGADLNLIDHLISKMWQRMKNGPRIINHGAVSRTDIYMRNTSLLTLIREQSDLF